MRRCIWRIELEILTQLPHVYAATSVQKICCRLKREVEKELKIIIVLKRFKPEQFRFVLG